MIFLGTGYAQDCIPVDLVCGSNPIKSLAVIDEQILKPFRSKKIDEANKQVLRFCKTLCDRCKRLIVSLLLRR